MKILLQSLLPKKLKERYSQNFEFPNIKPRLVLSVAKDLQRLKYIFIVVALLGYYPALILPTSLHSSEVLASEQIAKVSSDSLPYSFNLPHPGYLSTPFSSYHPGVDLATGLSMPIHPIAPGQVTRLDYGFFGLGHEIVVSHPGGFESTYGHMGRIFVKLGDKVTENTILGEVGLTGHTSGPHTHLEIRKDSALINPQTVLPEIPPFPAPTDFMPVGGEILDSGVQGETNLRKTLRPDFS